MAVILFCEAAPGREAPKEPLLVLIGGLWVLVGVATELSMRFSQSFELQLLPGGVRLKSWWRDELLIEPEVVGGRIRLTDEITLREGKKRATICLGWFTDRRIRAAIVEHCSQFLTNEQQAEFGRDWSTRYHRLLTCRKPTNPYHLLVFYTIVFAIGSVVLMSYIEYVVAQGATTGPQGHHLRWAYAGWLVACLFFGGLTRCHFCLPGPAKKLVND
ncbi:hypothetical protein [Anatilimnocola floriformis]|uniref:hypothetical protein n=1 Tax=Anatilimnocola floriformis TaxID=2948575 RepID=UPI0020C2CB6C|nr:hypothetical protein [Anatilimnocola floriformis]